MKGKSWFITLGIVAVSAQLIAAERVTFGDRLRYEREIDKFGPNELKLDLFGTYATRDREGEKGDHWGGGAGLNWFLTDNIGVSVDSYLEELRTPYRANASLVLRLPIETIGMAPYVFGGGGRQWEIVPQWTRHAGVGLDMRMNRYTGFFVDGRRVFPEETDDYTLVRAGFRLGW
jgi:hypothetical protein